MSVPAVGVSGAVVGPAPGRAVGWTGVGFGFVFFGFGGSGGRRPALYSA